MQNSLKIKDEIIKLRAVLAIFLLFTNGLCYSQLSDFNLTVTATDQTCTGNGALQMSVSNTTPGSTITYTLYLLPDVNNPIAETTEDFFNSLQAGNYSVVATQILSNQENSQQQDITINDLTTALDYQVSHTTSTDCDPEGTITVNVLSGNAVLFEIISGPVMVSPQSSNIFPNLQAGSYVIRVFDDCDNAVSKTYTMVLNTNNFSISNATLPVTYNDCDEVDMSTNIIAFEGYPILYPLLVTYTILPPDGSPNIVVTQNISSGPPEGVTINQIIPLFGSDNFIVNMQITDSCDDLFEVNHPINPNPKVNLVKEEASCGEFLNVNIENFFPPYNINFTSFPTGFDPSNYNADYPGPYTQDATTFGDDSNLLPIGTYNIDIIDACGRIGTGTISIEEIQAEPIVNTSNSGCSVSSGFIGVSVSNRELISVIITAAPTSYSQPLPHNVSNFINNGMFSIQDNIPPGNYTLLITDDCGVEYTIEASVPDFEFQELMVSTLPNCETATGSLNLSSAHGSLNAVVITSAPATFNQNLPADVSNNINDSGSLFINNLPIGNYIFESTDECGFQYTTDVTINSYSSNPGIYTLSRNCGSFDVTINDFDESTMNQTYWLQRLNPDTNIWTHPNTEAEYTEGQIPNTTTAIQIENFETLFNVFLTGEFRLIKVFQPLNTTNPDVFCLDIFTNFTIFSDLIISGVYNLDCTGGSDNNDVIVDVIGVEPFNFSIIAPSNIDNGANNTFTDLAPGTYEIRVEDACGSIENIIVNLENLLPLARANTPDNLSICRNDSIEADVFILSDQNAQILGNQNPNNYNVTYHLSQEDANTGNNALPDSYTNITNPQTIYARVFHNNLIVCYATTSFQIFVGQTPVLSPETTSFICPEDVVTLTADPGFDSYLWSTGDATQTIIVDQPGTYQVAVTNNYGAFNCNTTKEFVVVSSEPAIIQEIKTLDWTATENTITVLVTGAGNYQFSLDNINYQTNNTFSNLLPGDYTVYIKDLNGCDTVTEEVYLLNYPRFFTPNGDNKNDVWQIKFSNSEPELQVVIFDRYGKLITQFGSQDAGWDGTYNGQKMPTSDYWFEVTRANGAVYKGHFTLKR
ncbi:T9SS type B sorting domain-containing protein [Olleya aquimaris]|uniref:Gliding motility-associated-like protein n=1 Tax=Olleya aquimaris TaxID=639310 RepID=A0A327RIL5_9FLAO|nr:T9SS type B sorting domain-containing protein [Olleya aquimaris]RAJ16906.1 gliding motility-associated-like protein [Olleya aquimaris]